MSRSPLRPLGGADPRHSAAAPAPPHPGTASSRSRRAGPGWAGPSPAPPLSPLSTPCKCSRQQEVTGLRTSRGRAPPAQPQPRSGPAARDSRSAPPALRPLPLRRSTRLSKCLPPAAVPARPASPAGSARPRRSAPPPRSAPPGAAGPGAPRAALPRLCPREEVPLPPELPGRTGWGLEGNNRVWDKMILLKSVICLISLCLASAGIRRSRVPSGCFVRGSV